MPETVTALYEGMTGRWWVRTQGSEHLFDLDRQEYTRHQLDGLNAMAHDGKIVQLSHVHRWPVVGETFLITWVLYLNDLDHPVGMTHRSSTIRAIERAE